MNNLERNKKLMPKETFRQLVSRYKELVTEIKNTKNEDKKFELLREHCKLESFLSDFMTNEELNNLRVECKLAPYHF